MRMFVKTTAGYHLLPYKIVKPWCDFLNEDEYFYPEMAAVSDMEFPSPCPLPNVRSEVFDCLITTADKIFYFNLFSEHTSSEVIHHHSRMFQTVFSRMANIQSRRFFERKIEKCISLDFTSQSLA